MSDSSYVSGNLYKLGKKLSETAKKEVSAEPEAKAKPPVDPALQAAYLERYKEMQRVRRDVEMRLAEESAYVTACHERLSAQVETLSAAIKELQDVRERLAKVPEPSPESEDFKTVLRNAYHEYENARLDIIKLSARVSGSDIRVPKESPANNAQGGAMPDNFSGAFRLFLPLGVWLLICALLMAGAFIFAWKVAL